MTDTTTHDSGQLLDQVPDFPGETGGLFELTTFSGTRTVLDYDDARSLRLPAVHADGRTNRWPTDYEWQPLAFTRNVQVNGCTLYSHTEETTNRTSRVQQIRRLTPADLDAILTEARDLSRAVDTATLD